MKKSIIVGLLSLFLSLNAFAYSYAAAGKEPSIDAKEAILKALNEDDFVQAKAVFEKNKEHYDYLSLEFRKDLSMQLEKALEVKDKEAIHHWLNISLATELQRRLDGGFKNIEQFNVAKVMLAKADKFYKLISPYLEKNMDVKLKEALKKCTESIGNPGLFGVGAKPINKEEYQKNEKIAVELLHVL